MEHKIERIKSSIKSTEYFFFGMLAFVIIAIAIMMTIYIPAATKLVEDHSESEIYDSTAANAVSAGSYFTGRKSTLTGFSQMFLDIDLSNAKAVEAACMSVANASSFRHIGFTGVDGVTISSFGYSANTSKRAFVKEGLAGESSFYAHVNCDFDGEISDMCTVPIIDRGTGKVLGALTGDSVPFEFANVQILDTFGNMNCSFILDAEGYVVYCVPDNDAGIRNGDRLLDFIDNDNDSNNVSYLLNSISRDSLQRFTIDGKKYMAQFIGMNGNDWTFATIVPAADAYTSFGVLITFTVVLIIVMGVLLVISVIGVMLRMRTIKSDVTNAVSEGLKSFYVDSITGHDTVGRFRENFAVSMKDTATGHALISLDVDRFKAVNDTFGYDGGNEIIRKLSDIIKMNIGKNDFFARSSGDLFYILVDFSDKNEIIDLLGRIFSDVEYQITEIKLNLAAGIYIVDDPHIRSRVAADRADMARDSVKNGKESGYAFFDASMLDKIRREKRIEDIMEDSLALGEFVVYLQPKVALSGENAVVGAEALVRWLHDGKLIPPGDFIPVFEKNGFVTKLDYYMFEEVCKLQKKYLTMGFDPKLISVNMSRVHINKIGFVSDLASICQKYDLDTSLIEIEITESAAYEDTEKLYEIFREIKSYGFHVSIDDFGTGYSSLNMLKDLPVDVLKIDRSFLTDNADEHENASIVIGGVVALAASLDISTICEGIETKEQANLLTKLGCNMAQGFFFARPMPVADYEKLAYGIGA